ncbi:MAG: SurA N-terminal domain-containing protein [Prevotella sp.]|nr:SurA N-terminal domain-containing protein [Prevotella sp.]
MAVLGKIRSKGVLLVSIIGLGLFAFIAEEAVRSCESTKNNERQQIAEVLGEKITYQEFQEMVDQYSDVIKMTQGKENLNEDELNQVRDMVWNQYIQSSLIAEEAKELGLKVTDDEIRNILNEGTNPMLTQTPFVNQQTGRFDANVLKQFLNEYKKAQQTGGPQYEQMRVIYNYWQFMEKNLRQQLLAQKYQTLLAASFLSNKIEAKQAYLEENTEANIELAALPYSMVADKDIKVTEEDLKAKYNELKNRFRNYEETRDIKYVSYKVAASATDRAAINKEMASIASQLASAEDPAEVVRKSGSSIAYLGVPVLKTAFPKDIQDQLDSMAVGSTTAIKENAQDNTLNIVRLISKQELPDSVEFQAIQIGGETVEAARTRADSVLNAVKADAAQWDALAKKYGQTGEKTWMTSQQYQFSNTMDADTKAYITAINTMAVGETRNLALNNGNVILKVTDRKGLQPKYVAAVVKKDITFSKDTYSKAFNKFSQFVSGNLTQDGLEKNAKKNGYVVEEQKGVSHGQHLVAGIHGSHDALKWVFEAEKGDVSPLYECGDNDNLLVLVVTNINEKGYYTLENEQVKEYVRTQVIKDKKAEKLLAKFNGVKNIAQAKAKGAKIVPVNQITFNAPAFIQVAGASEPALSGAVAATQLGKFSSHPVKGEGGVYMFQVKDKRSLALKYDEKSYLQRLAQRAMQMAGNFMQELYIKADIKDNRYMFF